MIFFIQFFKNKLLHFIYFFLGITSWFKYVLSQDCYPYAVHISLGPYYQNFNSNDTYVFTISDDPKFFKPLANQTVIVQFQTNDICVDMRLGSLKNDSTLEVFYPSPKIERFDFWSGQLQTNKSKYIYNVTLLLETTGLDQVFNYSILNKDQNNTYVPLRNFTGRMPIRDMNDNVSLNSPQTFLFVGNMDISSRSEETLARLQELALNASQNKPSIDIVVYLGDMAYNLKDNDYQKGDTFLNTLENFTTVIPIVSSPGSRESDDNFLFYSKMFKITTQERNGFFYSFNIGYVHFVQINMAYFLSLNSTYQGVYEGILADDLKAADSTENRKKRPWIFVYADYPLYCGLEQDLITCDKLRQQNKYIGLMETAFNAHQVDLYFSSNYPLYQRSNPLYHNNKMDYKDIFVWDNKSNSNVSAIFNPTGTIYIVEGIGGNSIDIPEEGQQLSMKFNYSSATVGYGMLTVIDGTTIYYEHVDASTGLPVEKFYIVNKIPKWDDQWTPAQEYYFVVASVLFVVFGILVIALFQIYVDGVM